MLPRRKIIRLSNYDYSRDNLYFVTTRVNDQVCCLGEIENGELNLNEYGKIVEIQLNWLENQYPYVKIHSSIIMPDHVHLILEINRTMVLNQPIEMKIKSLSELMGAFKTTSSKHIHLAGLTAFFWQRSFYEHIIRDEQSYQNIVRYIENNPKNWKP
ncbi:MAG: transposase [Fluviicola sp.]|nr:transposase [Fluviicola sp.]